jgi:hypothetical protein
MPSWDWVRVSSARETAPRTLWGTDEFLDTTGQPGLLTVFLPCPLLLWLLRSCAAGFTTPVLYGLDDIKVGGSALPCHGWPRRLAMRRRTRGPDANATRHIHGAPHEQCFAWHKHSDLIQHLPEPCRENPPEVLDIIRILNAMNDEVSALGEHGLADFGGALTCDNQR